MAVIRLMISLNLNNLHWLGDNPEQDLCAHGAVTICLNEDAIASEQNVCVSAAAIYLLRTLSSDHDSTTRVGEHLLPCCGHMMLDLEDEEDVVIIGCPNGYDWSVRHANDNTTCLTFNDREPFTIDSELWKREVGGFATEIFQFYQTSADKQPCDEEQADGYNAMMSEWNRRVRLAGIAG